MALEKILEKMENVRDFCKRNTNQALYNYCVDVASGWAYYTPMYALQEAASGKDFETIYKTRLIGLAAHALVMRPVGLLRNYVAKKMNVTNESSIWDKMKVNLLSVTPPQAIVYGAMLAGGMALSGNYDFRSSAIAWGMGIGLGALHSFPYGWFQDKFRKTFGVRPAIKEKI